jgi:hypothetical protein
VSELFWRTESCTVHLGHAADGALQFSGHDLRAFGTAGHEYEYVVTVGTEQLPALRRALDVEDDADVLAAVLARAADVMATGEATWLTAHGVVHEVSVWSSQ